MYGCPRSRKIFFERLGRVIGCGHVSGLLAAFFDRSRYGDARTSHTNTSASSKLSDSHAFPGPDLTDHLPLPFDELLTRLTFPWLPFPRVCSDRGGRGSPIILAFRQHSPNRPRHLVTGTLPRRWVFSQKKCANAGG